MRRWGRGRGTLSPWASKTPSVSSVAFGCTSPLQVRAYVEDRHSWGTPSEAFPLRPKLRVGGGDQLEHLPRVRVQSPYEGDLCSKVEGHVK